uniref:Uncharacterized protein n=1 Tax=viral metagenome TaxID=1070528 RepID=A0A6C0IC59_9ZZZZ
MVDTLEQLPTDRIPPTQEEKEMLSWLYLDPRENVRQTATKVGGEFRTVLWIAVVFFLLSIPPADGILHSFFPMTQRHPFLTTGAKTFIFLLIAWVLLNASYLWKNT